MYEVTLRFEVEDADRLVEQAGVLYRIRYGEEFCGYADETREVEDALEALAAFAFNSGGLPSARAAARAVEPLPRI